MVADDLKVPVIRNKGFAPSAVKNAEGQKKEAKKCPPSAPSASPINQCEIKILYQSEWRVMDTLQDEARKQLNSTSFTQNPQQYVDAVYQNYKIDWSSDTPSLIQIDKLLFTADVLAKCPLIMSSGQKRLELYMAVLRNKNIPLLQQMEARLGLMDLYIEYNDFKSAREQYDILSRLCLRLKPAVADYFRMQMANSIGDEKAVEQVLIKYVKKDSETAQEAHVDPELVNRYSLRDKVFGFFDNFSNAYYLLKLTSKPVLHTEADYKDYMDQLSKYSMSEAEHGTLDFSLKPLSLRGDYVRNDLAQIDETSQSMDELMYGFSLCLEAGDLDKAETIINQAMKLNPYSAEVISCRIRLLLKQGKPKEAEQLLHQYSYYPRLRLNFESNVLMDREIEFEQQKNPEIKMIEKYYSNRFEFTLASYKVFTCACDYFPQSISFWQTKADYAEALAKFLPNTHADLPALKAQVMEAKEKAMELSPKEEREKYKQLKEETIRYRLFNSQLPVIDGRPVYLKDFHPGIRIDAPHSPKIHSGEEFNTLLSKKEQVYYVGDKDEVRDQLIKAAKRYGYNADLSTLSVSEAILLCARLTEEMMNYDNSKTQKADVFMEAIDKKIENGDFKNAVCRHYAAVFAVTFDAIKDINPGFKNVFVDYSVGPDHAWNTVFILENDKMTGYVLDPSADDLDGKFGNNLGGLQNYGIKEEKIKGASK